MTAAPDRTDPGSEDEAMLWRLAREAQSAEARDQLFSLHLAFARRLAARHFRRGQSGEIEFQELCQLAYTGLLEAIDRFDPDRGVPFRGYASRRITGAILNGLGKISEVREQISFRSRVRAERLRSLSADAPAPASAREAMDALTEMALGLALGFMLEGSGLMVSDEEIDRRPNAYESLAWKELLSRVSRELDDLPEREQMIIRRHYINGVDFSQLAAALGLSKGRVSQLHRSAIETLRRRLALNGKFSIER